jgi:Prokaryotic phospholipase A2
MHTRRLISCDGHPAVVTDPFDVRQLARQHQAAAETLSGTHLPQIPAWTGVAANLYRDRVDAIDRRRVELVDAHRRVESRLHDFAFAAQHLLDDLAWRAGQRNHATEELRAIRQKIAATTDPIELARLQQEAAMWVLAHTRANDAWHGASAAANAAERDCARALADVANLAPLPSLASRVWHLPLGEFMTYRAMVVAGAQPAGGLNWASDGCSDKGAVTRPDSVDACVRHDFGYRNWPGLAPTKAAAKAQVDHQFGVDLSAVCHTLPKGSWLNFPVGGHDSCMSVAVVGYLGVRFLGEPDANESAFEPTRYQAILKNHPE